MVKVIFDAPYRFTPDADRRVSVAYAAGTEYNVTRECVLKAKAAGIGMTKKGLGDGNLSEDEGDEHAEGTGGENAENGSPTDDGSGEGEREGT